MRRSRRRWRAPGASRRPSSSTTCQLATGVRQPETITGSWHFWADLETCDWQIVSWFVVRCASNEKRPTATTTCPDQITATGWHRVARFEVLLGSPTMQAMGVFHCIFGAAQAVVQPWAANDVSRMLGQMQIRSAVGSFSPKLNTTYPQLPGHATNASDVQVSACSGLARSIPSAFPRVQTMRHAEILRQ